MSYDPITAGIDLLKTVINKAVPDKDAAAQLTAQIELQKDDHEFQLLLGQLQINKTEAEHVNWFVAGWRPFVGWVCAAAFFYSTIVAPAFALPATDTSILMQVLLALLGIAGLRTYEKNNDSESNR